MPSPLTRAIDRLLGDVPSADAEAVARAISELALAIKNIEKRLATVETTLARRADNPAPSCPECHTVVPHHSATCSRVWSVRDDR